jgi:serine/threonine protein phosphatase PrpC
MESTAADEPTRERVAPLGVVEHAALTDVGREREHNEDSYLLRPPLFVVADGMGGAEAGEVASQLTVETFGQATDLPGSLGATLERANARIHEMASSDSGRQGMGCTCTAVYADSGRLLVAHVGDSRLYRLRAGAFEQLTDDHSLVGGLVRLGQLTEEEAENHPQKSVILRAVGVEASVEVDLLEHELADGDVYLACSDGLSGMVRTPVLAETLQMFDTLEDTAEMLIELANAAGGRDNITALLFRIGPR